MTGKINFRIIVYRKFILAFSWILCRCTRTLLFLLFIHFYLTTEYLPIFLEKTWHLISIFLNTHIKLLYIKENLHNIINIDYEIWYFMVKQNSKLFFKIRKSKSKPVSRKSFSVAIPFILKIIIRKTLFKFIQRRHKNIDKRRNRGMNVGNLI